MGLLQKPCCEEEIGIEPDRRQRDSNKPREKDCGPDPMQQRRSLWKDGRAESGQFEKMTTWLPPGLSGHGNIVVGEERFSTFADVVSLIKAESTEAYTGSELGPAVDSLS